VCVGEGRKSMMGSSIRGQKRSIYAAVTGPRPGSHDAAAPRTV
jgi:hypothetical protein